MSARPAGPILCSTRLRPPIALGPDRVLRLASEAGFEGLAVDGSVPLPLLHTLAAEALRAGMPVALASCPLPEAELGKGKRLPHLAASDDPEERLAAVKLSRRVLEAGAELAVRLFALDLGPAALRAPEAQLRLAFSRREMGEDEPGGRLLRRALEERKARAAQIFDACRASLEALLEEAGRREATLALSLAATPWQVGSPREVQLLLREFRGARLKVVLCPARRAALGALGLGGPPERWTGLAQDAEVLLATDQVGLEADLLLGLGELEEPALTWPGGGPGQAVVSGAQDAAFKEILRARRRLEAVRARATAADAGGAAAAGEADRAT